MPKLYINTFECVSACRFNTPASKPFPVLCAGKSLLASTSSHVPLSFAWAPDPLVTIITFPAFLAGNRLLAGMGPHVLISVCWAREPLMTNVALVVNHLKEK